MFKSSTRHQKGRRWASFTLVICGAFSIWANVRSGKLEVENVVISVFPPIVAFATSHLIGYFSPRKIGQKILVWGGMGSVMVFAMIGSGTHIVDTVSKTGQHALIGFVYIFITDAPMLLAGAILVEKVPTAQLATNTATPAKRTPATKATKPPVRKQTPKKSATPTIKAETGKPDIFLDPLEKDMLTA